jgi:hypothetical protein
MERNTLKIMSETPPSYNKIVRHPANAGLKKYSSRESDV